MLNKTPKPELHDAINYLDHYYARLFGCPDTILRSGGWHILAGQEPEDRIARMFHLRHMLYLLAPVREPESHDKPTGVALVAKDLRSDLKNMLDEAPPESFYGETEHLARLSKLARRSSVRIAPGSSSWLTIYYTTAAAHIPYIGSWLDFIGPLDRANETDPYGIALLINYIGGVYAARIMSGIAGYVGMQSYAERVWELTPPRLTPLSESDAEQTMGIRDREGLRMALLTRATRATLSTGAIPVITAPARDTALRRLLRQVGYSVYAHASVYANITD